ncbi:hypothetical protein [Asticcacaulis solisilvae]|uniref:hypothetical protein n=1 Tax=Asticcacaulis solisilvae TaxID=1217274 RepID=UPI003FD87C3F
MGLFDDIFGKKKPARKPHSPVDFSAHLPAIETIGEKKPLPPDLVARGMLAAFESAYTHKMSDGRPGIHIETLLSALGAMAGFGCQIAVREVLVKSGRMPLESAFVIVRGVDGSRYFLGDQLNQPLLMARVSVWTLVAGAVQHTGSPVPDINGIVRRTVAAVGSKDFGRLSVPDEHQPFEQPIETLKKQWAGCYEILKSFDADPFFMGWYFALSAQLLIIKSKTIIDPTLAGQIVMESAVAMAKIDPKSIGFEI